MKRILLIDFENVQKLDFELIDLADTEIAIFVGKSQNRIPFPVVEKTQALGERVKWLKIAGDGKNNLDFHIAFELGRLCERLKKDIELIILSMDSGYDSLMKYINDSGVPIKRISNLAELADSKKQLPTSRFTSIVVSNLKKIDNQKRPRTGGTLKKHIESLFRDKVSANEIDLIVEEMFITGLLTQTSNRLKYDLDSPEE
ncbi:MAG: PIN domain-containing protein [Deltaproteobacteria bacterium]